MLVGVDVFVGVAVGVSVGFKVLVGVAVGVFVGLEVGVSVGVDVGVFVGVPLGVSVGVLVGVDVFVEVAVGVSVGVDVGVSVGVRVDVLVGVELFVVVCVGVDVWLGVCVGVEVLLGVLVGVDVLVGATERVAVSVGVEVEVAVGVTTNDGVGARNWYWKSRVPPPSAAADAAIEVVTVPCARLVNPLVARNPATSRSPSAEQVTADSSSQGVRLSSGLTGVSPAAENANAIESGSIPEAASTTTNSKRAGFSLSTPGNGRRVSVKRNGTAETRTSPASAVSPAATETLCSPLRKLGVSRLFESHGNAAAVGSSSQVPDT